jgi:hypothetical protein
MTLSIMTLNITTLRIHGLNVTFSINVTQRKITALMLSVAFYSLFCGVIVLNVIIPSVAMLNVVAPKITFTIEIIEIKIFTFCIASGGGTVAEHPPQYPEVKGSSPATKWRRNFKTSTGVEST